MGNRINYTKLTFELKCEEDAILPSYLGSTIRGTIGNGLRHICCTESRATDCLECRKKAECHFTHLFTSLSEDNESWIKGIETKPNSFIIEPPLDERKSYIHGDELTFNVLLIGSSIEFAPYFILAVENAAQKGLGANRKIFKLERVVDSYGKSAIYEKGKFDNSKINIIAWQDDESIFPQTKEIEISFLTPFRFKQQGKLNDSLNFEVFIRNVLRRASALAAIYCDSTWDIDYKGIIEDSRNITIKKADLNWRDWQRYSNKSKTKMKMGGVTGKITFKGNLPRFLPYIELGSIVHIGKGCTMGLGKYKWEVL